jgi:hypothetical protein
VSQGATSIHGEHSADSNIASARAASAFFNSIGQVPPVAQAGAPVRVRTVTFHPAKGDSSPQADVSIAGLNSENLPVGRFTLLPANSIGLFDVFRRLIAAVQAEPLNDNGARAINVGPSPLPV